MKENGKRKKIEVIGVKMVFRVYNLKFVLQDGSGILKNVMVVPGLENMKIRKMVVLMRLHMVLELKLLIKLWKVLNAKWNNILAID